MPGPKACTKCGATRQQGEFTATQYKRAARICKSCCPAGAAEATETHQSKEEERLAAEQVEKARQAAAAREEQVRLRELAKKREANVKFAGGEEAAGNKGGKDLREREVKADRNAKQREDGF